MQLNNVCQFPNFAKYLFKSSSVNQENPDDIIRKNSPDDIISLRL